MLTLLQSLSVKKKKTFSSVVDMQQSSILHFWTVLAGWNKYAWHGSQTLSASSSLGLTGRWRSVAPQCDPLGAGKGDGKKGAGSPACVGLSPKVKS